LEKGNKLENNNHDEINLTDIPLDGHDERKRDMDTSKGKRGPWKEAPRYTYH
jgi:hypothetical protein